MSVSDGVGNVSQLSVNYIPKALSCLPQPPETTKPQQLRFFCLRSDMRQKKTTKSCPPHVWSALFPCESWNNSCFHSVLSSRFSWRKLSLSSRFCRRLRPAPRAGMIRADSAKRLQLVWQFPEEFVFQFVSSICLISQQVNLNEVRCHTPGCNNNDNNNSSNGWFVFTPQAGWQTTPSFTPKTSVQWGTCAKTHNP